MPGLMGELWSEQGKQCFLLSGGGKDGTEGYVWKEEEEEEEEKCEWRRSWRKYQW